MQILLVGQPNVGKSVIMNALTGTRAMISNYPGTTVELTTGQMENGLTVVDTPGTYTLHPDSDEQRVTQHMLMHEHTDMIINVVDAANLSRNLYLTLQLLDFEIPMVIALNQMDRAHDLGIKIDMSALERILGVPVVPLSATRGTGIGELRSVIINGRGLAGHGMTFSKEIESSISSLRDVIRGVYDHSHLEKTGHPDRALAIHLLEHDSMDEKFIEGFPRLKDAVESYQRRMNDGVQCYEDSEAYHSGPLFLTCIERTREARRIAGEIIELQHRSDQPVVERIEHLIDQPATGIPILVATAFLSFKVITLAVTCFEGLMLKLAPYLNRLTDSALRLVPLGSTETLSECIAEGLLLPLQVVLPAMLSVNLLIALLEDSGLMSRFSVASDRLMSQFGLPGQAVIPMTLGLGCRAPAVLATRMLADGRQRFIAMTLLGISVPCAASLGLIAGLVVQLRASAIVIAASMIAAFLILGVCLGRYLPGAHQDLVMEVPPFRVPVFRNVMLKTWMRSHGFLGHVLPLLLCTSVGVRLLIHSGALAGLARLSAWTYSLFGIPGEVFAAVVLTILQRYLAPALLLCLPLDPREATIACAMVSLSYPCLPVSVIILKEIGGKRLAGVLAIATIVPVLTGLILNAVLP